MSNYQMITTGLSGIQYQVPSGPSRQYGSMADQSYSYDTAGFNRCCCGSATYQFTKNASAIVRRRVTPCDAVDGHTKTVYTLPSPCCGCIMLSDHTYLVFGTGQVLDMSAKYRDFVVCFPTPNLKPKHAAAVGTCLGLDCIGQTYVWDIIVHCQADGST